MPILRKPHTPRKARFNLFQPKLKKKLGAQEIKDIRNGLSVIRPKSKNVFFQKQSSINPITKAETIIYREWKIPTTAIKGKKIISIREAVRSKLIKKVVFPDSTGKTKTKIFERVFDGKGKQTNATIERTASIEKKSIRPNFSFQSASIPLERIVSKMQFPIKKKKIVLIKKKKKKPKNTKKQ